MSYHAINLHAKFSLIPEQRSRRVIARLNNYQFKLVSLQGDFVQCRRRVDRGERYLGMTRRLGSIDR